MDAGTPYVYAMYPVPRGDWGNDRVVPNERNDG